MFSFKRSLIAFLGLLVIVGALATLMPLVSRGQGNNPIVAQLQQRQFYLTQTTHNGGQALSACASGYHMASLWEIFDTSNVRYNSVLGLTKGDSGFGPPTNEPGWIRTGAVASPASSPGLGNCNAWTSASSMDNGTVVGITFVWDSAEVIRITPWVTGAPAPICFAAFHVWCVQD